MANWTAFAAVTGVVLALLLVLSHLTQSTFEEATLESDTGSDGTAADADSDSEGADLESVDATLEPRSEPARDHAGIEGAAADDEPDPAASPIGTRDDRLAEREPRDRSRAGDQGVDPTDLTTKAVLANVAASQGLFALVILGAVIYTGVPVDALGIEFSRSYLETGLLLGAAFGLALYVGNELGAATATRFGFDHDEQLRELLAPESVRGWLVLLGVVLPIIAVFEELLFRAALIGALSVGFGLPPWPLAVVSSIAFAVGHGVQGSVGVVVTGVLGFVLAAMFVVTESFLVVVVAHYVINALEFAVHEGLEFQWAETLES